MLPKPFGLQDKFANLASRPFQNAKKSIDNDSPFGLLETPSVSRKIDELFLQREFSENTQLTNAKV